MNQKTVFVYDEETREFVCACLADASPREPGRYLQPVFSTDIAPPEDIEGKTRHFVGGEWIYRDAPAEPEQPPAGELTRAGEILMELQVIDAESVRPARAVALAMASGTEPDAEDIDMLALLEARAIDLRAELATLQ